MAGRLQLDLTPEDLATLYRIQREAWPERIKLPRYNAAPRQALPVITAERHLAAMRWGFPQPWKPRPFDAPPLINLQAETAETKATWKTPIRERRCLVPVTGFYEWVGAGAAKRPLCFRRADGRPMSLAAVWGAFDWEERPQWPCVSIVTCPPNATVAPVHDRMPVVVDPADEEAWLGGEWRELLRPAPDDALEAVEASSRVNKIDEEGPELLHADWTWARRGA